MDRDPIECLAPDGLLAVARGVGPELGRMVALGREALRATGAAAPERHMMLVVNRKAKPPRSFGPMGILLVSRAPFPDADVARVRALSERMQFEVELHREGAKSPFLRALATGRGIEPGRAPDGLNYDAPTDDRPFFFNMQRFRLATMLDQASHPPVC